MKPFKSAFPVLGLLALLADVVAPHPLVAQAGGGLLAGISVGPVATHVAGKEGGWDFGPVLGAQLSWVRQPSMISLTVEAQPFLAEGTFRAGDFRALFALPSYARVWNGRALRLGFGLGAFKFEGGSTEEGWETAFLATASASARIASSFFLEAGWKRAGAVRGLNVQIWSIKLLHLWGL